MKRSVFFLVSVLGLCSLFLACGPDDPIDEEKDKPLVFSSIRAGRTMIFTEDTTLIWTQASGYKITYHWHVEKGDLLGSGSEVVFVATPCTVGDNAIICTVKDGNGQEMTKQVIVTVL